LPVEWVRRISYAIPYGLIALLAWLGGLSWWAVAMLAGGFVFAWDWLWGDRYLLDAGVCLALTGVGLACLAVAFYLADGLGLSLGQFSELASQLPRRQRLPYQLPAIGVGLTLYGLLGWSRAWRPERNERW
jgi:hypothetical protein